MKSNLQKKTTTNVATREVKYEVYNKITGDAVYGDATFNESEAVDWLNDRYNHYRKHCCCNHQYALLKSGFPLGKRKAGTKGRKATKKQIDQWIEWWKINNEFWDALIDENGEEWYDDAFEQVLWEYAMKYNDRYWLRHNDEGIVLQYGYPIQPPK